MLVTTFKCAHYKVSKYLFWFFIIFACLYKLWLSAVIPFTVTMLYPIDQTWFVKTALSISTGNWVAETYNHYTLTKGPVYSIFLAASSQLGISPKLAIDALYVLASLSFLQALRITIHNKIALCLGFILVLANPITFSEFWAEPLRTNLYIPLVLFYLSALVALLSHHYKKTNKPPIAWMFLAGVSLALAWNTREESIWMLSGLFPLSLIIVYQLKIKENRLTPILSWLIIIIIPILVWHYLANINHERYGFRGISEFKNTQFIRAINAIYSLNTEPGAYLYLSNVTVDKMNLISDNTRRLNKAMLREDGITFKKRNAVSGSLSSWAIRSAMHKDGYYQDFQTTEKAYKAIAEDIEAYCLTNQGACRKNYISGLLMKQEAFKNLDDNIIKGFSALTQFKNFPPALDLANRLHDRGDTKFRYMVGRLFKLHTDFNEDYEKPIQLYKAEKSPKKRVLKIHQKYQKYYYRLLLLSLLIALLITIFSQQWLPKMVGLLMLCSFAASFAIYILISTFAVSNFSRALITCSVPMLCFSAYFITFGIQYSTNWIAKLTKIKEL